MLLGTQARGRLAKEWDCEVRPGPRPAPHVPVTFPGTATHSGPAERKSPDALKNQVREKIRPGLKGFCSHLLS